MNLNSTDENHPPKYSDDDSDYDDDSVSFQFESQMISIHYLQFAKYSIFIRSNYLISDFSDKFPRKLQQIQQQSNIDSSNIILFFDLLQNNFNIDENLILTYKQYIDLSKISDSLQIKKLTKKLDKYFSIHNDEIDFIFQIILYETLNQKNSEQDQYQITQKMENVLSSKINECLQNEKFSQLQISMIYRIIKLSNKNEMSNDFLYDFIKKSFEKYYALLAFLDISKLSDDRIRDLYETFSDEKSQLNQFLGYLQCNLSYIVELRESKMDIQKKLDDNEKEKVQLKDQFNTLSLENNQIKGRLVDVENEKNELKGRLNQSENEKNELQDRLNEAENEKNELQGRLNLSENEKNRLLMRLNEAEILIENFTNKIAGTIVAKVKSGLLFNAEIRLIENHSTLDTSKSKYIVSTSNSQSLGADAYKNGESITSLNQRTIDFAGKPNTYYVRALVVGKDNWCKEIVSNPVTVSGERIQFDYEGRVQQVVLYAGVYRLQVWGASGGDSTGNNPPGPRGNGGLGGYSAGNISLSECTKLFVYVGGRGKSGSQDEGSEAVGGFPDGGGTKTGHLSGYNTSPGTGGGSTSVRVSSDSPYARVIVAGGGGGASGASNQDHGGFGGGESGGFCSLYGKLQSNGAGTQTCSIPSPGHMVPGAAGSFGQGATGLYQQGCNSGGGGGGGWYGGSGGGHGYYDSCPSGGGGSGWVFTSTTYSAWMNGDASHARQFSLKEQHHLTQAETKAGNTSFPTVDGRSTETGHSGDGFALITPQ